MSLKLIELQVALPRTLDAGKLQEQLQQRGQHLSEHAVQNGQNEEELKRKTVVKQEKSSKGTLSDDAAGQGNQAFQQQKRKENEKPQKQTHPYKGKSIDYSG
ncbi:hypothetical protein [Mesobacillus harenae]|uniref:hypothetical protein n=1 Tax=Mesobacillus harenae TaxID=2213203 RepID=UPI00157FBE8A|nr:hypothetical protein [Mesobacillus harenae]